MLTRDFFLMGLLGASLVLGGCSAAAPTDDDDATGDDDDDFVDTFLGDGVSTFSAIGDVPYTGGQEDWLEDWLDQHNEANLAPWMIHLGDIKPQLAACNEQAYAAVATILVGLDVPMFIIPGDNEWNDCPDPDQAWAHWSSIFMRFEERWPYAVADVQRQDVREENFAFVRDGVLFVGINLVGGAIHDQDEWDGRFADNLDWLSAQLDAHGDDVGATVLLGHSMIQPVTLPFFDAFAPIAGAWSKPFLYLQGDGHAWIEDNPFDEAPNVLRIQVEGEAAQPVRFDVDPTAETVFAYERYPSGE
ncbi:MAG: hypothetical protein GY898_20590 [Proteobacteria bacterium]|nr:hypothetical protein [Pseudomonadota bacterium]